MESALQVLVAACLALLLMWACAPVYEAMAGHALAIAAAGPAPWWQAGTLAAVTLLGAGYPAVALSRWRPTRIFRDWGNKGVTCGRIHQLSSIIPIRPGEQPIQLQVPPVMPSGQPNEILC